jgi:TonB family protein
MSFVFFALTVKAQKPSQSKSVNATQNRQSNQSIRCPKPKIISFGVLNGKALNLAKPEYPSIGKHARIYGTVTVSVLIDEEGNVESAKVISGHPLLRYASAQAALQSKFEPLILSECPVKVSGAIIYNFLPKTWNWLEVGYALGNNYGWGYYSLDKVKSLLPYGYEDEKQLLQLFENDFANRDGVVQTVIRSIESKLNNKNRWLFSVGLTLAAVSQARLEMRQSAQNLNLLIQNVPDNISEKLLSDLRRIVRLHEQNPFPAEKFWSAFRKIEERFPFTGV